MKRKSKRFIALLVAFLMALAPMATVSADTSGNTASDGGSSSEGKLVDGTYDASMTLAMASGETSRRTFTCPDNIQVRDGQAYATIGVDSTTYTYAKVDGTQYPVTVTGSKSSDFEIPVILNEDMTFSLYSSSMQVEIAYILHVTATVPTVDPEPLPDPSAGAKAWIQANCAEGNIFSQCSQAYQNVITKEGDTYRLPFRSSANGAIRNSIMLLRPDTTEYKSGWFFDNTLWFNSPYKPTTISYKLASSRPSKDTPITATLKLYAPDTEDADIDSGTAAALAEYTCTIILEPKPASYTVTLEAQDTSGAPVEGVVYEIKDQYENTTTVNTNGNTCTLYTDRVYTITAKAEGYTAEDGSEAAVISGYTPVQAETKTFVFQGKSLSPAEQWIQANCAEGNIFSQCSQAYQNVITKEGDTYRLPSRSSANGAIRSSIKLLRPDTAEYKSGWFFDNTLWFNSPYKPTTISYKLGSSRPAADTPIAATLKLYTPDTEDADIDNDTAEALAEYTCTIILEPKPASYTVTLEAQDTSGAPVEGVVYEIKDQYENTTTVNTNGNTCTLYTDRVYTITAKAEGYTAEDGSEAAVISGYTPAQAEALALTLKSTDPSTELEDGTYQIEASTDSSMFRFPDCKLIVQNGRMWAIVTMAGSGFDRIYMGKAEYSATYPPEEDLICYVNNTEGEFAGQYTFWPVPISELDKKIQISGRSARKQTWYDHDLILNSATLKKISDELLVPDMTMEAKKLMQQFYIDGNVFVQNGNAVTKSGKAYTVPYYAADGTTPLTQVTLKRPDTAQFKSGWTFNLANAEDQQWFTQETLAGLAYPASDQTYTLTAKRPSEPVTVGATLSFYAPDTEDSAINNGTAIPLTSTDITFKISPQPSSYQVKFQAVDSVSGNEITNATIIVKDQLGNTVTADGTGSYYLHDESTYTVTAGAEGYVGQGGAEVYTYTFKPSEDTTIRLPLTLTDDGRSTVNFTFTDEEGNPLNLQDLVLEVKDADKVVVQPQSDGSYLLWNDAKYYYSVKAYGYYDISGASFTVSESQTKVVALKERIKAYKVTITAHSFEDDSVIDAAIQVLGVKDGVTAEVLPNDDGSYTLDWETSYTFTLTAEGFETRVYDYVPGGDSVEDTVNLAMSLSARRKLEKRIGIAEEFLATITEGDKPEEFSEGTKETLEKAIETAKTVLNKTGVTDDELKEAESTLSSAVSAAQRKQNPQENNITVRYQQAVDGPTVQKTITVKADIARKAGYLKKGSLRNKVTVLDVMVAIHQDVYGEAFNENPEGYLVEMSGFFAKIFQTSKITYNYRMDHQWCDYNLSEKLVPDGSVFSIYPYASNSNTVKEDYLYFEETEITAYAGENIALTLMGADKGSRNPSAKEGYTVVLENQENGNTLTAVSDAEGKLTFQAAAEGSYRVKSAQKEGVDHVALPYIELTVSQKQEPAVWTIGVEAADSKTDKIIDGAKVTVTGPDGEEIAAGTDGSYALTDGVEYTVTVSAEGYKGVDGADQVTKTIIPSKDEVLRLYLVEEEQKPAVWTIGVEVADSKTDKIIDGAKVTVTGPDGAVIAAGTDGSYALTDGVEYTVTASAEGYKGADGADQVTKTIIPSKDEVLRLYLVEEEQKPAVWTIGVEVADSKTDKIIDGAKVTVTGPDGAVIAAGTDGSYALTDGVEYTVTASAEGYKGADGADRVSRKFTPSKNEVVRLYLEKQDGSAEQQTTPTPAPTQKPKNTPAAATSVKTGDETQVWPYALLLAVGASLLVILKKKYKKA